MWVFLVLLKFYSKSCLVEMDVATRSEECGADEEAAGLGKLLGHIILLSKFISSDQCDASPF